MLLGSESREGQGGGADQEQKGGIIVLGWDAGKQPEVITLSVCNIFLPRTHWNAAFIQLVHHHMRLQACNHSSQL